MYYHYTNKVMPELKSVAQDIEPTPFGKPNGFWITDDSEDSWKSWCIGEDFNLKRLTHRYGITLDESDLLFIRDLKEFDKFDAEWAGPIEALQRIEFLDRYRVPNWRKLAEKYKGIMIFPYFYQRRFGLNGRPGSSWYYPWDCASGCIWDTSAITKIELLDVTSVDDLRKQRDDRYETLDNS